MLGRLKRWQVALCTLAAVLTVTISNCAQQPSTTTEGAPTTSSPTANASTLVFGSGGDPASLEPGNIEDGNSIYVQHQIYDRLIDYKPGTTELEPALATEWEASDDGLTWTFKLREGVKFHDGTDFNAEAVRVNVNRWWDPADRLGFRDAGKNYAIWEGLFGGYKGSEESTLQSINVVDDTTIEFTLKEPFAAFPAAIASGYFGIASPTAIEQAGADYGTASVPAIGTGPYKFVEWRIGDRVVLERNPDYWKDGFPKTDQLVMRFIKEPSARLAELRAGSIDFTVDIAPDQLNELQSDSNLQEVRRPPFNVGYLALNTSYEPLANKEVRQAIAMAINRKGIVDSFWSGLASSDSHFTPPSMDKYQDSSFLDYEYNPERAKQMLAEAGYPDGFPLELWYMPVSRPYYPTPKPIAEAFAADLGAVGINVTLNTKDWAAYLADRLKEPGYQAFMLGWTGDYGDPDNFLYYHFGVGGTTDIGGWRNEEVFKLLEDARKETDDAKRVELYQQAEKIIHDEAVRIPVVHSEPLNAQRSNISDWVPSPLGSESFETVTKS
ncbi:ABC transporter substrate-binding protein [Thermocoleostomius sinensis]|uniref:ABC transporter substrate-binding protein n=1 Tax=Thermocoleostomius sinensis A174 TaxID=2016057 RepID=A0A9E8ZC50_9CYAN|nr:ABC transporter substrate-binding protein [Thermocoleostomius sinensis]WAL60433.1 ABC transporter substrate-binding protein [Thermocoleostomius sinensis A174]